MSRLSSRFLGGAIAVAILSVASPSNAEDASDAAVERARAEFAAAVELVDQGDLEEALEIFERLYQDRPHPVVLYNMAWCYSRLGMQDQALDAFQAYLEANDDTNEDRFEAARAELERLEDLGRSTMDTPEQADHPPPDTAAPRGLRNEWFWGLVGLTGATTVVMTVIGIFTLQLSDQWLAHGEQADRDLGVTLRNTTDSLLVMVVLEAVATLVVGLRTNFQAPEERARTFNTF